MTHFYVLLLALGIGVIAGSAFDDGAGRRRVGRVSAVDQPDRTLGCVGRLADHRDRLHRSGRR